MVYKLFFENDSHKLWWCGGGNWSEDKKRAWKFTTKETAMKEFNKQKEEHQFTDWFVVEETV